MDQTKTIRIIVDSSRAVDGSAAATRALANLERQAETMNSTLGRMEAGILRVSGFLRAQLSVVAFEVGQRIGEMARNAFDAAAGMGELAEKVGLTARQLQAVQFVGVQNGATLDDITTATTKFSVKMGEAAEGSKEVIDALKALGVQNLDLQGKLRPNADMLAEVAKKISDIEDPARRSAAQVAFFGKSGTTMSASLQEMSKGLGTLSQEAQKFGAMISDETSERLDRLGDALDRNKLKGRAFFADLLVDAVDYGDKINDFLSGKATGVNDWIKSQTSGFGDWVEKLRSGMDEAAVMITRFNAQFVEAFKGIPDLIGKAIVDGLNAVLRGMGSGLTAINDLMADYIPGVKKGGIPIPQLSGGGASFGDYSTGITAAGDAAVAKLREQQFRDADARERAAAGRQYGALAGPQALGAASRNFTADLPPALGARGGGYSSVKDDGKAAEAQAEKLQKLKDSLTAAAEAQNAMTAAARQGDVAFQEQQAAAEATSKAIDFFGGKVSAADPKVKALAETLQKPIFEKMQGAAAQSFVVATTELEKQNVLLAAQNKLMNEAPDIQAREIALIKSKQEAEKAGNALTADDIEARRKAIEQNETLKTQAEQMKAANELWTEPLKQGLRDIQTAGADAWEKILETGDFSFKSLGDVFTKTIRRMAAEFLALATIRPIMTMAVDVIGPGGLGLIGGNTASQLGFSGGGGTGGIGSLLGGGGGGGGLGSLFSSSGSAGTGWLARQFSGVGDFLGSPVSSLFGSSATPAGGFANVGDLLASGQTGASAAATGGLSIGGALGGIGSIGMGAYGLLSGKGGTASTIGSIGQIAGGVMMMIPGLQPFGAALSMLSAFLPGLFGDGPKIPPQPALAYGAGQFRSTGTGGYSYGGDSLGSGSAMTATATTIAGDLTSAFRTAGLSIVPSALIGGNIASGTDHVLNGQQWQDRPYTETGLILPGGSYEGLTINDASRNSTQASEYLLAQAFKANVLRGGVTGAGAGLKAGLETINPTTKADLDNVIAMGTAYDALGKTLNPAKTAIDKITASFDSLKDYATQAGLSLDPINDELAKQSKRSAQDFIDKMVDPLAVSLRALDDDRAAALESAKYIRDNIKGVNVDINKIVDYYGKERVKLEDQYYGGAITDLKTLIDSLTPGGKLSGLDPTTTLAGLKASYDTTLSGARKGDVQSIADLASVAGNYADYAQTYYGGSTDYTAIRDAILAAAEEVRASAQGGSTTTTTSTGTTTEVSPAVADLIALQQRTQAALDDVIAQMKEMTAATTKNSNLTSRLLTTKV